MDFISNLSAFPPLRLSVSQHHGRSKKIKQIHLENNDTDNNAIFFARIKMNSTNTFELYGGKSAFKVEYIVC